MGTLLVVLALAALRILASLSEKETFPGTEPLSSNFELVKIKPVSSMPALELADEEEALRKVCQARYFLSPDTPDHSYHPSRQKTKDSFELIRHPYTPSLKIGVIFYTRRLRI